MCISVNLVIPPFYDDCLKYYYLKILGYSSYHKKKDLILISYILLSFITQEDPYLYGGNELSEDIYKSIIHQ
ncbi:MAG: hypothetical protein JXA99_06500, partial [Candidatus Lokiarchaeota archaeon]|nr:hypothetical protein [Candidatus Lokiarchaeota archaeon]